MWWLAFAWVVAIGCGNVRPLQYSIPPLMVLEQQLPSEPKQVGKADTASPIEGLEPDTAVAGLPVRRLPTLRESMERLAAEQRLQREALEELQHDIQRMGLLLAELTELMRRAPETTSERAVQRAPASPRKRSVLRRHQKALRASSVPWPDTLAEQPTGKAQEGGQASSGKLPAASVSAQYARALQLIARQQYGEAWKVLETLTKEAKEPTLLSNIHYWRGDIAFRQGNYAQAIAELQAVVRNPATPKAAAAYALLAESYLKQGERDRARQALQTLVQRFPTSEFAPRARKLLQQL